MSMQARIHTDSKGDITLHMRGGLNFENNNMLKTALTDLINEHPASSITIDMDGLNFVGSSGIGHFVDTINYVNKNRDQIKLKNVSSEFLKVFKLYKFDAMDIIISNFETDDTESLSQKFANRKRTFEN